MMKIFMCSFCLVLHDLPVYRGPSFMNKDSSFPTTLTVHSFYSARPESATFFKMTQRSKTYHCRWPASPCKIAPCQASYELQAEQLTTNCSIASLFHSKAFHETTICPAPNISILLSNGKQFLSLLNVSRAIMKAKNYSLIISECEQCYWKKTQMKMIDSSSYKKWYIWIQNIYSDFCNCRNFVPVDQDCTSETQQIQCIAHKMSLKEQGICTEQKVKIDTTLILWNTFRK